MATAAWKRLRALPLLDPDRSSGLRLTRPSAPPPCCACCAPTELPGELRPDAGARCTWLRRNMCRAPGRNELASPLLGIVLPTPQLPLCVLCMLRRLCMCAGSGMSMLSWLRRAGEAEAVGPEEWVVTASSALRGVARGAEPRLWRGPVEGVCSELGRLRACMDVLVTDSGVRGVGGLGDWDTSTASG